MQLQTQFVIAAAVHTGKRLDAGPAYGQQIDRHRIAVGEPDGIGALVDGEIALDLHETEHVDVEMTAHLQQFASATIHAQVETAVGSGGHAQRGLAGAVIDHQGLLRRGRGDVGTPFPLHREADVAGADIDRHAQIGDVDPGQRAAEAYAQVLAVPEGRAHFRAGQCGEGVVQRRLHVGPLGVEGDGGGGVGLAAMHQRQRELTRLGGRGQRDALHFRHRLGAGDDLPRSHRGQRQVAVVRGEVGDVPARQLALEQHLVTRHPGGAVRGVVTDHHVAGTDAGMRFQCGLDVGRLHGGVGAVLDRAGLGALVLDAETAGRFDGVRVETDLEIGQVLAHQSAAKGDAVAGVAAQRDRGAANAGQRRVQRALHLRRGGAETKRRRGVGVIVIAQTERERAARRGVDQHPLRLARATATLTHVVRDHVARHALRDGDVTDVLPGQTAQEFDDITVAALVVAVERDHDAGVHAQQRFERFADVALVVGDVVLRKTHRLGHAVQRDVVGAPGTERRGEDDGLDFVAALRRRSHLADLHLDRRRRRTQRFDADALLLGDAGLGGGGLADAGADGGRRGGQRDALDVAAGQRADEFDLIAGDTIAADQHVAGTDALQAFQRGLQFRDELRVGLTAIDVHLGAAGALGEGQHTHGLGTDRQAQQRVHAGAGLRLCRQGHAAIDVHLQILHRHGQAIDADERGKRGGGLQTGVFVRCIVAVGHQRQREVGLPERDAERIAVGCVGAVDDTVAVAVDVVRTADAGKGVDVVATQGDPIDLDTAAVGQHHAAGGFLEREVAFDAEESEHVEIQMGRQFQRFTRRTIQAQIQRAGRTGGDLQRVGGVIHHGTVAGRLVDRHLDVAGGDGQTLDTGKRRAVGAALQAGPFARRVVAVGEQGQRELDTAQFQTQRLRATAVQAGEGVDAVPTQRQQIDVDHLAGGQHDCAAGLLQRQIAFNLEEAEQIELEMTGGTQQLATRAVHVEGQAGIRTGGHGQRRGEEIDHRAVRVRAVDLHGEIAGGQADAADADELDRAGDGVQRRPTACRGGLFGHHRQREADVGQRQAERVGAAAVHAGKRIQVARPHGQQIDHDGLGRRGRIVVGQRHRRRLLVQRESAVGLEEAEHIQIQVAMGLQQRAIRAGHVERQRACRPGDDLQSTGGVIDDRIGAGGAVNGHRDVARSQRQAIDADQRSGFDLRLQTGPLTHRAATFLDRGQCEAGTGQLQAERIGAAAVQPGEGEHVMRADGQQIDADRFRRCRRVVVGIGQGDLSGFLLEGEIALDLEKPEQTDIEMAAGLQHLAVGASHIQRHVRAGPGRYRQRLGREIDYAAVGGGIGHHHGNGVGRQRQAVDTDHAHLPRFRLQAHPLARRGGIAAGHFFRHQRQGEAGVTQLQTHGVAGTAVDAGESADAARAYGQQIDVHPRAGDVVQNDALAGLLERETAGHLEEAADLQGQIAARFQQRSALAVDGQRQAAARSGGDGQRHRQPVDQTAIAGGLVDVDAHGIDADGAVDADQADVARRGTQRGPLARGVLPVAGDGQREGDVLEFQAHRARRAAADTGKRVDTGRTDGEQIDLDHLRRHVVGGVGVRQRHRMRAFLDGKVAFQAHETEQIQLQVTGCLQQFATRTVEVELEAGAAWAGRHVQVGLAGAVVHHQRPFRLGRGDLGLADLGLRQFRLAGLGAGRDLHRGDIDPGQAAAELQLQCRAGPLRGLDFGAGETGKGGIERGLDVGQPGVERKFRGGVSLPAVAQTETELPLAGIGGELDLLYFRHRLGAGDDLPRRHRGQVQAAVVRGEVGDVPARQLALEQHLVTRHPGGAVRGVVTDHHVAGTDAGMRFQCGLDVGRLHGGVGAVLDRAGLGALVLDAETAGRFDGVRVETDLEIGQVLAHQSAAKGDAVAGVAAQRDRGAANAGQRRVQRALHLRRGGAETKRRRGVGVIVIAQTERERAARRGVDQHPLRLARATATLTHVVRDHVARHALRDGDVTDVLPGQTAQEFDDITVAALVVAVERDHDAGVHAQQRFERFADVALVVGDVVLRKTHRLGHAVQRDVVGAPGTERRGEDDGLDFVAALRRRSHLADLHLDRRRRRTQRFDADALLLGDTGLRVLRGADRGGEVGGDAADREIADVGAGQRTDEFDAVALETAAGDGNVACTDAAQAFQAGREFLHQLEVAFPPGQHDAGGVAAITEFERAGHAGGEAQRPLRVPTVADRRLGGQRDAPVDVDRERVGAEREAVDADEFSQTGAGLQRGVLVRGIGLVAHQREREVDVVEAETEGVARAAVQAGEGVDVLAT